MRYILLGQVLNKKNNYVTKVLGLNYFEQPEDKIMKKYIKEILSFHATKIEIKDIMSKINNSKDMYRVERDVDSYTIIRADPGAVWGTYKTILAKIWVQSISDDMTPKQFTEYQLIDEDVVDD